MTEASINSNVGVNINPTGLSAAADEVQKKINGIVKAIENAGSAANNQLKALAIGLKQVQTLQSAQNLKANSLLGNFTDNAKLGQQARALGEFRQAFDANARAADVLRGRVRALRDEEGKLLRSGKELSSAAVLRGDRIKETATQYNKLGNEISNLRGRIALLSDDGKKAFTPMLKSLEELDKKNAAAFANNRRNAFGPELTQTRAAVNSLKDQVSFREKLEAKTRLNITALKEEAQQILRNSTAQKEANLAAAVRSGQSQIRNANVIGSGRFNTPTDQTAQRISLTNQLVQAQAKLNSELSRPVPRAKHLDDRIAQIKQLEKELGLAIALQAQFDTQSPSREGGFLGGVKHQAKALFSGGDEGGGAFGAGALLTRVAGYAAAAAAVYGLISAIQQGLTFAVQFEDALAQLQAISGATATEMDNLSNTLFEVSKNSSSSIMELTQSATILAQAGFASGEIDQLLQNVTALADASGSTASEAVDVLTSTLGAFQLNAGESTRVVDGLVAVLNSSKLSIQQAQLGLQYLGATAKENSITFEELNAIMGTAADAGIRSGSTAATGTRQFLIDLIDPSKKLVAELEKVGLTTQDIDVKTLGLVEVLQKLNSSGFQAYGALETRAAAMYEVLSSNIPKLQELTAVQSQSGTAADAQAVKLDSLSSRWQILLNRLNEIGAMISTVFIPVLKKLVDVFSVVADGVKVLFEFIGSAVTVVGQMATALSGLYERVAIIGGVIVPLGAGFDDLSSSSLSAADAADIYGASLTSIIDSQAASAEGEEALTTALNETQAQMAAQNLEIQALDTETSKLITRKAELEGQTGRVSAEISSLSARFPGLRAEFDKTAGGAAGLIQAMFSLEVQAQRTLRGLAATQAYQYQLKTEKAKEAGVTATTQSLRLLEASRGTPSAKKEVQDALRKGDGGLALSLAQRPGSGFSNADISNIAFGANALTNITTTAGKRNQARNQLQTLDYALSPVGQTLRQQTLTQVGRSNRAASQGNAEGTSASGVLAENSRLRSQVEKEYNGTKNAPVKEYLGNILAQLNTADNKLKGNSEEGGAKKTGGGGGRRGPSGSRAADRASRDNARVEELIDRKRSEASKQLYENVLLSIEKTTDSDKIETLLSEADKALTDWLVTEGTLAVDQIKKYKPTDTQKKELLEAAAKRGNELRVEQIEKISDVIEKSILKFVEITSKSIEREYNESMEFTNRNLRISQARRSGLDNPLTEGKISNAFKTVTQRRADEASQAKDFQDIKSTEDKIRKNAELIKKLEDQKDYIESELSTISKLNKAGQVTDDTIVVDGIKLEEPAQRLDDLAEKILNLKDETKELVLTNDALKASYDVINENPTNFADALRTSIEAAKIDMNYAGSMGQELLNNLDQPLQAIHQGFKGFFSDLLSGTVSVGGAFKSMAGSIIDSLLQMVAVAAANQLFSFLLSSIGGAAMSGSTPAGSHWGVGVNTGGFAPVGSWRGGTVKGYYGGGNIKNGLTTRDSTLIHAAKGEYVIRSQAANSLGLDTLDSINARGAEALKGMGTVAAPVVAPTPVQTNVYVISPEEKPQLGPNDVIAIIASDVLKGGTTKKLIKQVSNG